MPYRAVLFDLDGTLLDTLADIAEAADVVLRRFGFPTHGINGYRRLVGDGVQMLFAQALPPAHAKPEMLARCAAAFREAYEASWNHATRPYDGVTEMLDALEERRIKLAVLSNKPDRFARLCVEEYLPGRGFQAVLGLRDGIPRKPDPAAAVEIAARLGVPPREFVYLGDTPTDIQTAQSAGMLPVGATWGFRPAQELRAAGAAVLIDAPMELIEILSAGC